MDLAMSGGIPPQPSSDLGPTGPGLGALAVLVPGTKDPRAEGTTDVARPATGDEVGGANH